MTTYSDGTVTVTNGSATVTGSGTAWSSALVAGDIFTVAGDTVSYVLSATPGSNTSLTLTAPYGGTTGAGKSYEVNRDRTPNGIPIVQRGDLYPWGVLGLAFAKIDALIVAVTGGAYVKQAYSALLTSLASVAVVSGDLIYGSGAAAVSRLAKGANGQILALAGGLPAWANPPVSDPQGRLTLSSGVPVLTSDVTGAGTIYYTPFKGDRIPIYDGTRFLMTAFSELSQALTDTTKSPAAAAASKVYDLFVWNDAGTLRLSRGPAWPSDTSRGTGVGTSELQVVQGFRTNKIAITNGPGAGLGTWVGTIRTNASSVVPMLFKPAAAAGGTANLLYCWNAYNRVPVLATCRDSTDSWTYTTATVRSMNGNANNSISYIAGAAEGFLEAHLSVAAASSSGQQRAALIGYDATNALADGCVNDISSAAAAIIDTLRARLCRAVDLGLHTVNACEYSVASGTTTWYGDNASAIYQSGLTLRLEM